MELILTDAEKKAATWAELDNESIGMIVKAAMFKIKTVSGEQDKIFFIAAAIILCNAAVESNADRLTQTLTGLTIKGKPLGDWKVTIKKQ